MQPPGNHVCMLGSLHTPTTASKHEEDTQALLEPVQSQQHVIYLDSGVPFQGGQDFRCAAKRVQCDDMSHQ